MYNISVQQLRKYYSEPLYRNSLAIMLNSATSSIFGLLFWVVAARTMPAAIIGLATAAISSTGLISTLSNFGLDVGLIRYLPQIESENKDRLYNTVITVTLVASLVFGIGFMALVNFFSPSLSFIQDGWFPILFIAYVAFTSISYMQSMAFTALRRADLSFAQSLVNGIRIILLLVFAPMGVSGIFIAINLAFLASFIFSTVALLKYNLSFLFKFDIHLLGRTLNFSLLNYTAGILLMAQSGILPIIILNTIGPKENAYFYIAISMAGFLFMIPQSVAVSLFVEGSYDLPIRENVMKSLKLIGLLLIPAVLVLFLFGDKILLLFSAEYSEKSFEVLQLLALSSLFSIVVAIFTAIKRIQKDVKMINIVNTCTSILILGLGYVFLAQYGLIGLGYAWLITNVLLSVAIVAYMFKNEKWARSLIQIH